MAETKREIERKYEATTGTRVPDLTKVRGVSRVRDAGRAELDAVYYDTPDLRLAAHSLTLRRRTGGDDAGWHLKLPVAPGVRDEIRAPLGDEVPSGLAGLVRARTRGGGLVPVVRVRSSRHVHHLVDEDGAVLAELSTDTVHTERLTEGGGTADWAEIEIELADGGDPALLDAVDKRFRKAGIHPAAAPSKLARALEETGTAPPARPGPPARDTAGGHVLGHLRAQADALLDYDAAVRRDQPDSVHQMRVATRRMRSAFRSYGRVLDRTVTDPVGEELRWLAAELGVDRDQEVLTERLRAALEALPRPLLQGPVRGRLRRWSGARRSGSRGRTLKVLDSARYLALLDRLEALLADPPLRGAAAKDPGGVLAEAVLKDHARVASRVEHALSLEPGRERDLALHDARKAAKRARYAAELARPALGRPAKRLARSLKRVQDVLGDHQDGVVAREALKDLAQQAHAAGEPSFTWGVLYAREETAAADRERELPEAWAGVSVKGLET
ncbi:CYTH and CHAD domain-containing protein [Streptomyces sp. MUM 203J]|uniref:CYTH and CHAD domain-containing protein n=1 Tax=Streptomyces sp. MUM 203J TaxID=2791990 RepID=UPI001F046F5B|nr:CYTH and CHAD domain-containing protein [Streptomyces sp. MUM 203J]MCH0542730.1 CYTH and CHAD domain-containing protein [Streptomyces sp. MUM 203J]